MDYVREYIDLMREKENITEGGSVMQRAERRYKRLLERGIIDKEEPFIVSNTAPVNIKFNQ